MLERYEWVDKEYDLVWTVGVVEGRTEADVVRAYGGNPSQPAEPRVFEEAWVPQEHFGDYFHIQTLTHVRYVVAIEPNGWIGSIPEIARRASTGGRFLSVFWNINGNYKIVQAIDGQVVACFNPMSIDGLPERGELRPPWIEGRRIGLHHLRSTCLALVEEQTGLAFDRKWLDIKLPVYRAPAPRELLRDVDGAWLP